MAVVGSVLVHALAFAVYAARDIELPTVAAVPSPPPPVVRPTEPPVLEVVFLDDDTRSSGGEPVAAASQATTVKRGRITRHGGTQAPGTETPSGGATPGPGRSPYMTMRKPGSEGMKGPSADFLADFMNRSKPLPPPPDIPGERLQNQIADVRARLRRAGRYSPDELAALRAELVALNEELANEELKPAGGGTYKTEKETFRAKVNADGSVKIEDKPADLQDRIAKSYGIDSYAANKLRYLDRTRDQRVAIGKRYREQELKKSVIYMQQHIARLHAMTSDVAKRKQGLFDLWDECAETGTPEEIAGGEEARAFVMAHIRGTVTYTPEELRKLDAQRQSKQPFAP
ncbi:MAG: hypothetical protein M4D80_17820 [Myxococcota bacterium]|nr:hypothetical protein [Myxococcota bacterium]